MMRIWSIFATIAASILLTGTGTGVAAATAAEDIAYPASTVVLYVAGWCAPCHAEVARLNEIADAARPFSVRVMLVDDSRQGRELIRAVPPEQRWLPDPAMARRIHAGLYDQTAGLPYSVAIDAQGLRCGERHDGLDAERTRALVERCRHGR